MIERELGNWGTGELERFYRSYASQINFWKDDQITEHTV